MNATRSQSRLDSTRSARLALAATTVASLLTACGGGGGDGGNPPPPPVTRTPETLVYVADDGVATTGAEELYAVEDDGTGQRLLSHLIAPGGSVIKQFAVSPDKQWVAFIAKENLLVDALFVVPITGGTPVQISRDVGSSNRSVADFEWSPDSQRIVFSANLDAPITGGSQNFLAREVYLIDRDGSGETKISGSIGSPAIVEIRHPQWSPDGRYIVQEVFDFDTNLGPTSGPAFAINIYDSNTAGPNSTRLVTSKTMLKNVHWSPDSARLVYAADQGTSLDYQLYVIDADGGNNVQITEHGDFNSDAKWSPDGSLVAYLDHPSAPFPADLIVSAGTSGATDTVLVYVSPDNREVYDFEWSPDGNTIAYISDEESDGVREAYVIAADGSGTATKVSGPLVSGGDVLGLAWSPDGQRVGYLADQFTDTFVDLYVSTRTGTNTRVSIGLSNEEVEQFAWSRDGEVLAFSTGITGRNVVPTAIRVSEIDGTNSRVASGAMLTGIFNFAFAP